MSFRDMVAADNAAVFLNLEEFAEKRTIVFDDVAYTIPIVLKGIKEEHRRQLVSDHIQGLYLANSVMHCSLADLHGNQPEKGTRIKIYDGEGEDGYYREFYVATSVSEMGMLRIELEAIDE